MVAGIHGPSPPCCRASTRASYEDVHRGGVAIDTASSGRADAESTRNPWCVARSLTVVRQRPQGVIKDKAGVKRVLNEVGDEGDPSGPTLVEKVYEYRFVGLNTDGWLELVALVGGGRPSTGLEIVLQTPGGVPLPDRLTTTYEGFVMRELVGFDVPADLNQVLRDLDGDGTYEIVMPQPLGGEGASGGPRLPAEIPEVFAWKQGDFANVSARYPEFYRNEVLPRLERQLQMLETLPGAADPSDRADRRADRERVVREIAEARKRAAHK